MKCPNNHGTMEQKKILKRTDFRGKEIEFVAEHFVCPVCGIEVDDLPGAAINQKAISDAYRKASGLLTSEEIVEGRRRLEWTQEQLAQAMNVGVASIKRWERGSVQTKVMDDSLRKALTGSGPVCNQCCDPYTGNRPLSLSRIKLVLKRLCKLLGRELPKKQGLFTAKYLWYADMIAFRETGQGMTGATYAALPYGPQLNNYRDLFSLIKKADEAKAEPLTEQEERIIARIAMSFPEDNAVYEAAHREEAWKNKLKGSLIPYSDAQLISQI